MFRNDAAEHNIHNPFNYAMPGNIHRQIVSGIGDQLMDSGYFYFTAHHRRQRMRATSLRQAICYATELAPGR